ncbi:MAG: UTP--glucose-1-phosphate uridylyltransferase GalU [Thermoplasmata archaeon]|nr:UTP--glucose-1-phosphate uridylyltransferase GalU [Thermoplasmata archaeon]
MKAVIPAAGLGTRFLPATKVIPKEMVPILDKPAIQYVVEEAIKEGIEDILIITSRWKHSIVDHFDRSLELEYYLKEKDKDEHFHQVMDIGNMARIHYIRQKVPRGLGDALLHAKDYVGDEPFTVLLPDDIIVSDRPAIGQLMDVHRSTGGPVVALEHVPKDRISRYGVASAKRTGERTHRILDVVEKPPAEEAPSDLALIGRYVLPCEIFEAFEDIEPGYGGEIQLSDAIRYLLDDMDFTGYEFEGKRYDVGNVPGWLEANVEMALHNGQYSDIARDLIVRLHADL